MKQICLKRHKAVLFTGKDFQYLLLASVQPPPSPQPNFLDGGGGGGGGCTQASHYLSNCEVKLSVYPDYLLYYNTFRSSFFMS